MVKYKLLYSLYEINGERKIGLAWDWCNEALQGQELEEWLSDWEQIQLYEVEGSVNGYLYSESIYEPVPAETDHQNIMQIGYLITRDLDNLPLDALSQKWINRFKNDPSCIDFRDWEFVPTEV